MIKFDKNNILKIEFIENLIFSFRDQVSANATVKIKASFAHIELLLEQLDSRFLKLLSKFYVLQHSNSKNLGRLSDKIGDNSRVD